MACVWHPDRQRTPGMYLLFTLKGPGGVSPVHTVIPGVSAPALLKTLRSISLN